MKGRNVAVALVAGLLLGAAATFIFAGTVLGRTTTVTSTSTTTITPGSEIEPNGSLLMSKSWGPWLFEVSINATSAMAGDTIIFYGKLTYLGQANVTIDEADPIDGVGVYNSTGGLEWEYAPPGVNFNGVVTPGETFGGLGGGAGICIPLTDDVTSPTAQRDHCGEFVFKQQPVPGVYSVVAEPLFYSVPGHEYEGGNLEITANFTVF